MSAWAISTHLRVVRDLNVYMDGRIPPADVLNSYTLSLELVHRDLLAQQVLGEDKLDYGSICELLVKGSEIVKKWKVTHFNPPVISFGRYGRPRIDISYEQLLYLIENRFTVRQIADMVGVSERTIYRRMSEFSLSVHMLYSSISDNDLDQLVCEIQENFPLCGNIQMQGHLFARGLRVQQVRVREAQRRVDPEGCAMRRLRVINRRQYRVPFPLSLWHIDGNHKLIR